MGWAGLVGGWAGLMGECVFSTFLPYYFDVILSRC